MSFVSQFSPYERREFQQRLYERKRTNGPRKVSEGAGLSDPRKARLSIVDLSPDDEIVCPSGHSMTLCDRGSRSQQFDAFEDVGVAGWCDVCMCKCDETERFFCPECLFDICYRCFEGNLEMFLLRITLESGPLMDISQYIHGTVEVSLSGMKHATGGGTVMSGALRALDFDLEHVSFGDDPYHRKAIKRASVTFDDVQCLKSLSMLYENPESVKQAKKVGQALERLEITKDRFSVTMINGRNPTQKLESTGKVEYTRFVMKDFKWFMNDLQLSHEVPFAFSLLLRFARDRRNLFDLLSGGKESFQRKTLRNFTPDNMKDPLKLKQAKKKALQERIQEHMNMEKQIRSGKSNQEREVRTRKSMTEQDLNEAMNDMGKISPKDLIFTCVLCIISYLTTPKKFQHYYTKEREQRNLDPFWINFIKRIRKNEGRELLRQWLACCDADEVRADKVVDIAYQMFLPNFLAANFVQNPEDPRFGEPQNLQDGPLNSMNMEYYPIRPGVKGLEGVLPYRNSEMFFAMSKDMYTKGGDLVFAFQGSNDIGDMEMCLNCLSTPFEPLLDGNSAGHCACVQGVVYKGGKDEYTKENKKRVHIGWYNAFLGFKSAMERCLRDVLKRVPKDKAVRIIVTGHSAGAALCTNAFAWMLELFDETLPYPRSKLICNELTGQPTDRLRILCVTYGSPKAGNKHFAEWVDNHRFLKGPAVRAKYFRSINVNDPFTTLPPSSGVGFNYQHMTTSSFLINDLGMLLNITPSGINKLEHTKRGLALFAEEGIEQILMNHDMFAYSNKLLNYFWRERRLKRPVEELSGDPYIQAFGDGKFKFHEFTRSATFLDDF